MRELIYVEVGVVYHISYAVSTSSTSCDGNNVGSCAHVPTFSLLEWFVIY